VHLPFVCEVAEIVSVDADVLDGYAQIVGAQVHSDLFEKVVLLLVLADPERLHRNEHVAAFFSADGMRCRQHGLAGRLLIVVF